MEFYSMTDIGYKRSNNEDTFLSKEIPGGFIFLVCDGMGGHKKGEVASQMARDFVDNFDFEMNSKSEKMIINILCDLVRDANIKIYLKSKSEESMNGMGTTFSLALVLNEKLYVAHIGDSRIYLLKDKLELITKDHTLIGVLKERGVEIKNDDATNLKKYITKALGTSSVIVPDVFSVDLSGVKKILICSDGITEYLDDETLEDFLLEDKKPKALVEEIIDTALKMGGNDNITCTIVEIGE